MTLRSLTRAPFANRSNANDEMSISDAWSSSCWVSSSAGAGEGRRASRGLGEHLLEELPARVCRKAGRLLAVAHADEHPVALRMKVQRRLEIDGHRIGARHGRERAGDRDVTAVRQDRNLEAGHASDRRRPRA